MAESDRFLGGLISKARISRSFISYRCDRGFAKPGGLALPCLNCSSEAQPLQSTSISPTSTRLPSLSSFLAVGLLYYRCECHRNHGSPRSTQSQIYCARRIRPRSSLALGSLQSTLHLPKTHPMEYICKYTAEPRRTTCGGSLGRQTSRISAFDH